MARKPNIRLREAIAAAGCTYDALARDVRQVARENGEVLATNKSAVSHWASGAKPTDRTVLYLAEALSRRAGRLISPADLGMPGMGREAQPRDPVAAAAELGRADAEHRRYLTAAMFTVTGVAMPLGYDGDAVSRMLLARTGTAKAGAAEVAVIRHVTAAFTLADERLGGGHGLTTAAVYLADTAAPCSAHGSRPSKLVVTPSVLPPSLPPSSDGNITTSARKARRSATTRPGSSSRAWPTPTATQHG